LKRELGFKIPQNIRRRKNEQRYTDYIHLNLLNLFTSKQGYRKTAYLSREKTYVSLLYVTTERHLKKSESHGKRFHDVCLAGARMVTPGALTPRHLGLDGVEPLLNMCLQALERASQLFPADRVESTRHLKNTEKKIHKMSATRTLFLRSVLQITRTTIS
jgi:hypothetical protein